MKYSAKITAVGDEALEFLKQDECNFIILFGDNAPEELRSVSVLIGERNYIDNISVGDTLILCDTPYDVTAIGSEALKTLKELGHCTLCFKGGSEAGRPGMIMLEGPVISPLDIKEGATIEVY